MSNIFNMPDDQWERVGRMMNDDNDRPSTEDAGVSDEAVVDALGVEGAWRGLPPLYRLRALEGE